LTSATLPAARWWLATLLFGVAVLVAGSTLGFPPTSHSADPGYGAPVLAFEFARGQDDLVSVFGPDSDPMQVARLAAMRTGNERDYLYMLFYAGFVASGLVAFARELGSRPLLAAAGLPVLAALADAWENWLLFDIQTAFTAGDYSPAMASLPWPVAAKFLFLALANVAIGLALAQIGRWGLLFGSLVIAAAVPTVMGLVAPENFGWTLVAAIGGGWIVLLATAAIACWQAVVRKRPFADFGEAAQQPRAVTAVRGARKPFGRRQR
jgi:hypothetical protein